MELDDYLRDLAVHYRQCAAAALESNLRDEYLELARVCEEVANSAEEMLTPG